MKIRPQISAKCVQISAGCERIYCVGMSSERSTMKSLERLGENKKK